MEYLLSLLEFVENLNIHLEQKLTAKRSLNMAESALRQPTLTSSSPTLPPTTTKATPTPPPPPPPPPPKPTRKRKESLKRTPPPPPPKPNSTSPSTSSSSPPTRTSPRILRCFSNRYSITEDEIKRFIYVSTLVRNDKAKGIFRELITIGRRNDTSQALVSLNCYELADKLLNNPDIRTDENYDALKELMPSYCWETDLDDAIEKKNDDALNEYFEKLLEECKHRIESHDDFDRYRKRLLDKLKKCTC